MAIGAVGTLEVAKSCHTSRAFVLRIDDQCSHDDTSRIGSSSFFDSIGCMCAFVQTIICFSLPIQSLRNTTNEYLRPYFDPRYFFGQNEIRFLIIYTKKRIQEDRF
jgi:hypothetical protein